MPIFNFKCEQCGQIVERHVSASVKVEQCKKCGGVSEKQPSAPSFVVKGFNALNGYSEKVTVVTGSSKS